MVFLFSTNMIFFYGRKMKANFSQKIHGNMMFSVSLVKVVFPFPSKRNTVNQKSKDDLITKNTPKDDISGITEKDYIHRRKDDIGILHRHSRKSSNDSLYFYRDLFKCFHILLSNEKKPGNLIYRVEI